MRLMLGTTTDPRLLVEVSANYDPKQFKFSVINGGWEGEFTNGYITVFGCPGGAFSDLDKIEILCTNQDRLRCRYRDYQDVFNNFSNAEYVAPVHKEVKFDNMDDDIPF